MGILDVGSSGTVTVTSSTVTFNPSSPADNITTTAGTNLTYDASTALGVGVAGVVKNLTGTLPVASFMTFPSVASLVFNLTAVGPGVANTNCAALVSGQTCSVVAGSPFVLQLVSSPAGVSTAATFAVNGSDSDATSMGTWLGLFTAQIAGMTPAQIQAEILAGGSSTPVSFSGSFTATASPIPEPASALMVGVGLLGALALVRRRRRP